MVRFVTWAPLACYAVLVGVELTNPPPRREGTTRAGAYFTRTVQVSSDQPIVETGPYRLVRHPCQTGGIVEFIGLGIACGNWISLASVVVPIVLAYGLRIRVEERALVGALGEPYVAYMRRTARLIPHVV